MSEMYFVTNPCRSSRKTVSPHLKVEELMHPLHAIVSNAQLFELVTEELAIQSEEGLVDDAHDLLQVVFLVVWDLLTPSLAISDTIFFGALEEAGVLGGGLGQSREIHHLRLSSRKRCCPLGQVWPQAFKVQQLWQDRTSQSDVQTT